MATNESGEFEKALTRIEEIVNQLESGTVDLDASVKLFKEGRVLAKRCEELLKSAQAQVEAAAADGARSGNASQPGTLPF